MPARLLVIVGAGPGIGNHTAAHFATNGFDRIALLSRNAGRLEKDAESVMDGAPKSDVQVKTYAVDVSDPEALQATLKEVESDLGPPEVVLFNAARVEPTTLGETSWGRVLEDYKTTALAFYITSTWAMPYLTPLSTESDRHPTLLVSAGALHSFPLPPFFSLSLAKAAQFNLTESLSLIYGPKGVHICSLNIGGIVSPDHPVLNPKNIAKGMWELYGQNREQWEDVRDLGNIREMASGFRGVHTLG